MERWIPSSKRNPCPICNRTKDGDCRQRADGQMVFCHRGSSHSPPEGLRKGEVWCDGAGRKWAYTGESEDSRGAVFVAHQERAPGSLPCCQPVSAPARVATTKKNEDCTVATYHYRDNLRVLRYDYTHKKKEFQPQFYTNDGWNIGAGPEVWPFYGSLDAAGGDWIVEVEGEKCVDVLREQGIAAITHPGHQRDEVSCQARYAGLAQIGVKTVYFIADNDAPGRKKAELFLKAAIASGLTLNIIPAETIWGEVPEGGSVDDMPPEQLTTLIPVAIRAAAGKKPTPIDRTSYAKLKNALQEFYERSGESSGDMAAGIADIATAHGASVYDAKRIWDSLEEDRVVAAEALSATSAISQRQELEQRRAAVALDDYLPHAAVQAIEVLVKNLNCDPLTAISTVLTTAAGAFKAGHRVDAGDGLFVKEPVIWMLLAGASGTGKSPVMRILCSNRLRLVKQHYDHLSQDLVENHYRMYADSSKKRIPDEPEPLVTGITDFTTEALGSIIGNNHSQGLGTFMYSEEVKEILGNFDEYKSGGKGRGKETFLCLFDGNVNPTFRVGRRGKSVQGKVQNALLGGVQPGVFRSMVEQGDDAGLFARCLICPLPNEYAMPDFFRTPAEITEVHLAEEALENFYLKCLALDPLVLRLEPEAVMLFTNLHRDTFNKTQSVPLASQQAVYGKRLGYVLQIALAMHLMRVAAGEEDSKNLLVSKATLARAVILVDLLQSYVIVEQQESQMQQHGSFDLNRRIHAFATGRAGGITARQFTASCIPARMRGKLKAFHVRAAMEQLVEMRLGEWRAVKPGQATGELFAAIGKYPD